MPTGPDRVLLEGRSLELRKSLRRADPHFIKARLAQMFLRFPSMRVPDAQWEGTLAAYVSDLAEFPLWGIDRGIKNLLTSRVGSSAAFAPSSVEVRAAVVAAVAEARDELAGLTAVLTADVYHEPSDDEKKRVQDGFAKLLSELKGNTTPYDARRKGMTREDWDATKAMAGAAPAKDAPPVQISDELRAKLAASQSEQRSRD